MRCELDHCVIQVSDWEAARRFYTEVMGAEAVPNGEAFVFRFGSVQLNCQGPGQVHSPLARLPVLPGGSDLCFRWLGPIGEAQAHLACHEVTVEMGPVRRFGAGGFGTSVYFRDPDGSLLEFISYEEGGDQ